MAKLVFALGPFEVYQARPKVLACYRNGRFENNWRPADAGYRDHAAILKSVLENEAADREERAAFVAAGRARKAAARAAIAAERACQPEFAF